MSFKPMKPAQFDVSKVKFSPVKASNGGGKTIYLNYDEHSIYLQPPEMELPFDSGNFYPIDGSVGSGKYAIDVDLKGESEEFCQKLQELDEYLKQAAIDNSVAWFKKKTMTMDTVDTVYTPIVKVSVDRETGEPDGKYPPKFKFKINQYDGVVQCKCFDADKNLMIVNEKDKDKEGFVCLGTNIPYEDRMTTPHKGIFKRGTKVKTVLRCKGIWIVNGKFGCTWSAEQIRIKPPAGFDDYAFLDDTDEEERGEKIEGNFVYSSDEDDDEGAGLSRQVSRKQ